MISKIILLSLSYVSLYPLFAQAGSYMICVNPNDKDDWKWAPPVNEMEHARWGTGNKFIPIDETGTWLNGSLDVNKHGHPVLKTHTNSNSFSLERAKLFCDELQRQCQKLGKQYSNVFVKGHWIPPFVMGYISFSYYENEKDEFGYVSSKKLMSTTCQNMFYNYFPNEGGVFHILDS